MIREGDRVKFAEKVVRGEESPTGVVEHVRTDTAAPRVIVYWGTYNASESGVGVRSVSEHRLEELVVVGVERDEEETSDDGGSQAFPGGPNA